MNLADLVLDQEPISDDSQPSPTVPAEDPPAQDSEPRFSDLPLSRSVIAAVNDAGYESPTSIQAKIIPHMVAGRDVLAQSQTGSGKTAAFALPILSDISTKGKLPVALVLAPTRELADQVAESFKRYAAGIPRLQVAAIYGGQDYEIQLRQLRRGVQVVVGTPGRVIDHVQRGTLDLSAVETMVLDEADEMLNMGFLDDVRFIIEQTPPDRQTALFSATMPEPIREISRQYLNDPAKITIKKKQLTADSIRQRVLFVHNRDKLRLLCQLLEVEDTDGVIVFTKTKEATLAVSEQLVKHGFSSIALNGDMPQKVRQRAIEQLKTGRLDILVATDVAARGLDVTRVSHVVNFDLPHDGESYVHRIGRTGRAGRKGNAILFLTNAQRRKLGVIERLTKQKIEIADPPTADEINARRISQFKERISETIAKDDLKLFSELIGQYTAETGAPVEQVAAAIAHISQRGRPFLVKEVGGFKPDRDRGREKGDRNRERSRRRPGNQPRQRFRIEVGRRDGATPGNIVGAIANEAGLSGDEIGPIKIFDQFALVELPERLPSEAFRTLQKTRVAGKAIKLKPDRGGKFAAKPGRRHKNGKGGPSKKSKSKRR